MKKNNQEEQSKKNHSDYHRKMNLSYVQYGAQLGVNETFVRFLHDRPELADKISFLQPTDIILNSLDLRVLNMNLTYQFSNLIGERFYINEYMINVLRVLQEEVEQFILQKMDEYEPFITYEFNNKQYLFDGGEGNGYFMKKARELEEKKKQLNSDKATSKKGSSGMNRMIPE